ncbi:MAG: ThiF family adenylyltransferase [Chloroflexi bacterium]|nr:ThiF family adenylyltransferase [Chloroflexota bacterium]
MDWDRVERLIGTENLERLRHKRVVIVGLGSGGGLVAQALAMSGVGRFVLVDDDVLEASNVPRHVADNRYLGQPKVDAVAELIHYRNPQAEVVTRVGRIEHHSDVLESADLLVVGVDGENAKYAINQVCLQRNLKAIYAGVYERGEGGDVVVIRPYDGPCYACWAGKLREGQAAAPVEELDYGMIGPEGTLEAQPGLWIHVMSVAAVQADLALNELMLGSNFYKKMPANTLIMANTALEILDGVTSEPHTSIWVEVERDPQCLVCGAASKLVDKAQQPLSLDDLASETGIAVSDDD